MTLPFIEELFGRMAECAVFTVIGLAQGDHQMLVKLLLPVKSI